MSDERVGEKKQVDTKHEHAFSDLAERFRVASDSEEVKDLGDQFGRFVFGE